MRFDISQLVKERGIPIPPVKLPGSLKGFVAALEVGESVLVPVDQNRMIGTLGKIRRKTGQQYTTRKESAQETRVWRTA